MKTQNKITLLELELKYKDAQIKATESYIERMQELLSRMTQ